MKRIHFYLGFLILLSLFYSCTSISKSPGSIAKQVELVRDLEIKLPIEDRPRYQKFLKNIVEEESIQDRTIESTKRESEKNSKLAMNASEDAGKWQGIRNTFIAIVSILILCIIGYIVFRLGILKIPILT
ncbi:hypothetical protein LPTSP4_09050 [Leptospira ryugenii]|uniref:Lipoprotein n=1 Tax=Leptospira ryugenii TaxID=1917863 RepID=A0A2P2DXN7_9LEPT|nr:hypothetical protein LPTSP4_09050 [Leptospira ryugenii]